MDGGRGWLEESRGGKGDIGVAECRGRVDGGRGWSEESRGGKGI